MYSIHNIITCNIVYFLCVYRRPKLFCLIDSLSLRGYAQSDVSTHTHCLVNVHVHVHVYIPTVHVLLLLLLCTLYITYSVYIILLL